VQTDADWGGDPDRKSTSGVIVWVKGATGKWYLVQSLSRKQTTVALSTAEAELIAMLAGVCEMRGISQLWRWMLADGIIEDMKQTDEIVGSDSSAGISILKRKESSRRTKHVELKVFFLQAYCRLDYVKIMKVKTEDMLSDSLTKVMTMPKHHVQKCGLRDLNIALIGMVFASQVAGAEAVEKDRFPGSETFVIQAAVVLFLIGLFTGMWLAMKYATWRKPIPVRKPATWTTETQTEERVRAWPNEIFIAPHTGQKFHIRRACNGLNSAAAKRTLEPCDFCCV
jgi:hypothetical protein